MARRFSRVFLAGSLCLLGTLFLLMHARGRAIHWNVIAASMPNGPAAPNAGMAHMAGHMSMTTLRGLQTGDQQKADAVVTAAKQAMAPYQDYRKALADGYVIFLPNVPQPIY